MSRVLKGLIVLVVVVGVLQWFVPRWVGGFLAGQLGHYDRGPKPQVAVNAFPFWELAQGQFQNVHIQASDASFGHYTVQHATLNWSNGGVALAALKDGKLRVTKPGTLHLTLVLSGAELTSFLQHQGTLIHPQVTVVPSGVEVTGTLNLGGTSVPLDTSGSLSVSANHQAVIFHPQNIDGLSLPVPTNLQLVDVKALNLPMALSIESVQLGHNQLIAKVQN